MNLRRPAPATSLFHLHAFPALRAASFPIRYWNWKAASLSITARSLVYFVIAMHHGRQAGLHAATIEAAYVCLTSGFYSALQQGALRAEPRWVANLVVVAGVPILAQSIDFLVQHSAGTPNARAASIGMVCWGLVSAAFHLHLMRNGAMIVGAESRPFAHDLRRIPHLLLSFITAPVVALTALGNTSEEENEAAA